MPFDPMTLPHPWDYIASLIFPVAIFATVVYEVIIWRRRR